MSRSKEELKTFNAECALVPIPVAAQLQHFGGSCAEKEEVQQSWLLMAPVPAALKPPAHWPPPPPFPPHWLPSFSISALVENNLTGLPVLVSGVEQHGPSS